MDSTRERDASGLGREALTHADALYNLARYLTGDTPEAEDLVQETYARAMRAAHTFVPGTNLKAWMCRILRNAFIDRVRRAKKEPCTDEADDVAAENGLGGDGVPEYLRGAVARDIENALMALSPDSRYVVLLDLEGLTEAEAANVLGCPVNTVKSRLSRARSRLRTILKDYAGRAE